ncbi:MAG: M28 family peptidase, partial [Nitrososphaerales archaeon]
APHPPGSAEHARVRQYILGQASALGLQIEEHPVVALARIDDVRSVVTLHNYVARLPGREAGPALALMAHYDSMNQTPGAADDAAGIATMLEVARALQVEPARRAVLLIFSDGEDQGILGATGLAAEAGLVGKIGLLVNLDSPGRTGPALLFETSPGGAPLVRWYAAGAPAPAGYSLGSYLYGVFAKSMSYATDFTPFARAGVPGLNFAFAYDRYGYHTALDTPEYLDQGSLQHFGANALALARNFDGVNPGTGESIFFTALGQLFNYAGAWAFPVAVLVALLVAVTLAMGLHGRRLTGRGLLAGVLTALAIVLSSALLATLLWLAIMLVRGDYRTPVAGSWYQPHLYLLAFAGLSLAVLGVGGRVARPWAGPLDLAAGGLVLWGILGLAAAAWATPASYLFAFPAAAMAFALGWRLARCPEPGAPALRALDGLVLGLFALPILLLMVPAVYLIFQFFGLSMWGAPLIPTAGVSALAAACSLILLLPQLDALARIGSRSWITLGLLAFAAFFIAGQLVPGRYVPLAHRDAASSILYRLDADRGRAYWTTNPGATEGTVAQFFGSGARVVSTGEFFPPATQGASLLKPAPVAHLPAPELRILSDQVLDGKRRLRVKVTGPLGGEALQLYFLPEASVSEVTVNGLAVPPAILAQYNQPGDWPWLRLLAPPADGLEVSLVARPGSPLTIYVTERAAGFQLLQGAGIDLAVPSGDGATWVSKSFDL